MIYKTRVFEPAKKIKVLPQVCNTKITIQDCSGLMKQDTLMRNNS